MFKLLKYVLADILRNRVLIAYTILLLLLSSTLLLLDDNPAKAMLSLLNLVLFVLPLVCLMFATIYLYNSCEFIELLVSQPVKRKKIWMSLYWGISVALSCAFLVGVALPMILFGMFNMTGITLIVSGTFLTWVFVGLSLLTGVWVRDKARGIGTAILLWLYFALLFDGLVLFALFQLSDYPIEKAMVVVSMFNPVDLSRIQVLLHLDESAMMGYTGAVFRDFLGTTSGTIVAWIAMLVWIWWPIYLAGRRFVRKDL